MTFGREADEATSKAMVDRYLEAGGNFVDTADVYGPRTSEEITGRAIAGRRDDVVLATKVRFPMGDGPNDVGRVAPARHRRVRGLAPAPAAPTGSTSTRCTCGTAQTPIEETLSALTDLVRQGKVRYIGASNFAGWQLMRAELAAAQHGFERFVSLQPQYSLIERRLEYEIGPAAAALGLGLDPVGPAGAGPAHRQVRPRPGPPSDTRMADAEPEHVESWERRNEERNWRIVEAVQAVASEAGQLAVAGRAELAADPAGRRGADRRRAQARAARGQPRRGRTGGWTTSRSRAWTRSARPSRCTRTTSSRTGQR